MKGIPWAALLAALLAACLRDPIVPAGQVYDPKAAILESHLVGLDSVEILLVDVADSNHVIRLWSGHPDSAGRTPVHVAGSGEAYYFRLNGYRSGKGHCFTETIRSGTSVIGKDECVAKPSPIAFVDTLIEVEPGKGTWSVDILALAPFAGTFELHSSAPWIQSRTDSLRADSAGAIARTSLRINPSILEPGPHLAILHLRCQDRTCDSAAVSTFSDSIDVFGMDTLPIPNDLDVEEVPLAIPFTENPEWLSPSRAPWLDYTLALGGGGRPGDMATLKIRVDRDSAVGNRRRFHTTLYALGRGGAPMDSLVVAMGKEDWPGGIRGVVNDWNKVQPVPGSRVELWQVSTDLLFDSAVADEKGAFGFRSLREGTYRIAATAQGRLGAVQVVEVRSADTTVSLRVSPPHGFKALDLGPDWKHSRIGSVQWINSLGVVPSQGASGPGEVIRFVPANPSARAIIPQGNAAPDSSGRYLRAAEIAGGPNFLAISYPADSTIGLIHGWMTSSPRASLHKVPFQPFGLHERSPLLAAAGWRNDSEYVFAVYNIQPAGSPEPTLRLEERSLSVFAGRRQGRDTLGSGPLVTFDGGYYFIGEGTPQTGKVTVRDEAGRHPMPIAPWLATTPGNGLCHHQGMLYVASNGFVRIGLKNGLIDQQVANRVDIGQRALRIASADFINLRHYAFVSTPSDTVFALSADHARPLGRFSLGGKRQPRSVSTMAKETRVLVSDGERIYLLDQEK